MITSKIEDLNSTLKTLQQKTALIKKYDLEGGLNKIDKDVDNLSRRLSQADKTVSDLKLKVDDMENRSRRCNLRLTGLPEGLEETAPPNLWGIFCLTLWGPTTFPMGLSSSALLQQDQSQVNHPEP